MRTFLPTMAVILGLTNAILYNLLGDDDSMGPFDWELQQWPQSVLYAFTGIVVGLLVSGAFLRFARSGLRGSFFGRYGLIVLAVCLGGAVMGPLLVFAMILLGTDAFVPSRPSEFASIAFFAVMAGWVIGAVEGVVLGLPLAGSLGMFGDRVAERARPQA